MFAETDPVEERAAIAPIVFMPTFNVEPVEDIEHAAGISRCPTADTEAGPEAKVTAFSVSSGSITKVTEVDREEIAPISTIAEDACVAVEERDATPNLSTIPALETDPVQLIEDTALTVNSAVELTEPEADIEAIKLLSTSGSAETVAEPETAELPAISKMPDEGAEPVLVNKLAAAN